VFLPPICLSTDNPGVFGSQLTDEFYLAATAWEASYSELAVMTRASLQHCFAPPPVRRALLRRHEQALRAFEQRFLRPGWRDRLPAARVSPYARNQLAIPAAGPTGAQGNAMMGA